MRGYAINEGGGIDAGKRGLSYESCCSNNEHGRSTDSLYRGTSWSRGGVCSLAPAAPRRQCREEGPTVGVGWLGWVDIDASPQEF